MADPIDKLIRQFLLEQNYSLDLRQWLEEKGYDASVIFNPDKRKSAQHTWLTGFLIVCAGFGFVFGILSFWRFDFLIPFVGCVTTCVVGNRIRNMLIQAMLHPINRKGIEVGASELLDKITRDWDKFENKNKK